MTPRPESSRTRRRSIAVALLTSLALSSLPLATVSCGGGGEGRTIEIVVPAGTQARLDAGQKVSVMPDRLELRVGDTLRIRNDDSSTQSVGPYVVKAGTEVELSYGAPGRFEGYCPLSEGERYEIVVTE